MQNILHWKLEKKVFISKGGVVVETMETNTGRSGRGSSADIGTCVYADGEAAEGVAVTYPKLNLSFAVNGTDTQIDTQVGQYLATLVSQRSGGNITIDVFPNVHWQEVMQQRELNMSVQDQLIWQHMQPVHYQQLIQS